MQPDSTRRVFLAGPFKALVDRQTGQLRTTERARLEAIMAGLEAKGYFVHNAHRREAWGAEFLTPEACTSLDLEEISGSDVFVAFPGAPPSPGTHIEIGWASALRKPIVLLLEPDQEYAFLVRGLHTVADVTYLTVGTDIDLADQVVRAVLAADRGRISDAVTG